MLANTNDPKIIVALDYDLIDDARALVSKLDPKLCHLKIGKTLFTQYGPEFVKELISQGFSIFLDLKFHDIPQQVAGACRAAAELGVWMINVHVSGGKNMMEAAVKALQDFPKEKRPYLIGVTVLTSLEKSDLEAIGLDDEVQTVVERLAKNAKQAGLDGVVCSAQEAKMLRNTIAKPFLLVTPGIRLSEDNVDDQKRVMTPKTALENGVDYLVIGRSITKSTDPLMTLKKIVEDIKHSRFMLQTKHQS